MGENIKIGIIETMGLPVRPIPISNRCKVLKVLNNMIKINKNIENTT